MQWYPNLCELDHSRGLAKDGVSKGVIFTNREGYVLSIIWVIQCIVVRRTLD